MLLWLAAWASVCAQTPTLATTVPLLLPGGLSYDAAGNLYFAETSGHVIRRVSAGILTTVAGTGIQGFAGDGAAATAALIDSPAAVVAGAAGELYFADTHNHRIRRVDTGTGFVSTVAGTGIAGTSPDGTKATLASLDLPVALALNPAGDLYFADARTHLVRRIDHISGLIRTVAGSGIQGFGGDGGPAIAAALDTPSGIALDTIGNLYLADAHNHRVRRVDASTGLIASVAGTGQPGFSGDGGQGLRAALNLPRGLTLDAAGNLFLVDARNQRLRRIDAVTGQIATIAGDGTQAFAGDAGPAVAASLDSPRSVSLSPAGLPTVSDASNARVRQVDATARISTIAGIGTGGGGTLTLTAPTVTRYGTGSVSATLAASPATGTVTFFDTVGSSTQTLATTQLAGNAADNPIDGLAAGPHRLSATYSGDSAHPAAVANAISLTIAPAPVTATPQPVALLYGQPIPILAGTLTGVLSQDSHAVALVLATSALYLSPPGLYPITASLAGTAAGNYSLTQTFTDVTINLAPPVVTLSSGLAVRVASPTSGQPGGVVSLIEGGASLAHTLLSPAGDATFPASGLSTGSHTLTAVYAGDVDFLPATSAPVLVTIGPGVMPDFALAATGQSTIAVPAGTPATFSFSVTPLNGNLSSPILLTAAGLPPGASASFTPAYLPPSSGPGAFLLTIQTPRTVGSLRSSRILLALLLPALWAVRRKRRLLLLSTLALIGCGDRINSAGSTAVARTYNITVLATATSAAGTTLQHIATVTLVVQ